MRDKHIGQITPFLQIPQQVDHLRLNKHIERAGRLVEHDKSWLQDQCARECDALALAARKLMRIAVAGLRVEPDIVQRGDNALLALRLW